MANWTMEETFSIVLVAVAIVAVVCFLVYMPSDENTSIVDDQAAADMDVENESEEDDVHDADDGNFDNEECPQGDPVGNGEGVPEKSLVRSEDDHDNEDDPKDGDSETHEDADVDTDVHTDLDANATANADANADANVTADANADTDTNAVGISEK